MTATCKPVNVMVFLYLQKNKLLSCKSIRKRLLFSLFFILIFFVLIFFVLIFFVLIFFVIYVLCLYAIFRMWIIH